MKYFLQICKAGSIHRVAKESYISQQGLSRIIAAMESELGFSLLHRSRSGVTPTLQGEVFYKYARRIVSEYEAMHEELGLIMEPVHEQVSVVYAYEVLSQLTMQIPNAFRIDHPEIDLLIGEYPYFSAERMVQDEKFDLGFAYLPIDRERFDFTPVFKAPWPLLVHKDNPLSKKSTVTCAEVAQQNLVLMSESFKGHFTFLNRCRQLGITLNVIATINDLSESYKWVQDNEAVAFSTFQACSQINDPDICTLVLDDEVCVANIGIICRRGEPLSPAAQTFYDYTVDYVDGLPPEKREIRWPRT